MLHKYGNVCVRSSRCPGAAGGSYERPMERGKNCVERNGSKRLLRSLGGGLRSWLAVRWTRTAALRPPGGHSLRSRHSRAAASAPASLSSLTVPQRVRLGRAPRRKRRIDPLGARPLRQRTPGGRPHCAPPPAAAAPATGDPRRCGGVDEAACGARRKSRRAEPAASGRKVASVAEGTPSRARGPGPPASPGHREGKSPRASARYDTVFMRRST